MRKTGLILLLCLLLLLLCSLPAAAATPEIQAQADVLASLGLFRGTSLGFELDRAPTRMEALIMLIRLTGQETAAQACAIPQPFTDIPWNGAEPYLAYAWSQGLTQGLSADRFGSLDKATGEQYLTFMLRALGYQDGVDFNYGQAAELAGRLGLSNGVFSGWNNTLLRGDCAAISYRALSCKLKNSDLTLYQHLTVLGVTPADADLSLPPPEQLQPITPAYEYVLAEQVPILMYHVIADYSGPNEGLYLSPAHFQEHLDLFSAEGVTPITLAQLYAHWQNGLALPPKPVVLTFDDGYTSMYTEVFPRLQTKGWPATFFLFIRHIGQEGGLSHDQIREMYAAGMEIGSHSVNHLDLTTLHAEALDQELVLSKNTLEEILGAPVHFFCYPSGRKNPTVQSHTAQAGYLAAVTTDYGFSKHKGNSYTWPRIRINKGDDATALKAKLAALGYW